MNLNKTRAGVLVVAMGVAAGFAALVPGVSNAYEGQLNFTGLISDTSCTVTTGTANQAISLPPVSVGAVKGSTSSTPVALTPFSINMKNCSGTTRTGATVLFDPGATIDSNTGMLKNDTGTATNVEIGLYNADRTLINLSGGSGSQGVKLVTLAGATGAPTATGTFTNYSATANFMAGYVANGGTPTPGTVLTYVSYEVVYQ